VLFTSDHGEEFHEHGGIVHGQSLYEELVRVPLIVLAPAIDGGRVVRQPVSLLDLAPTLLELLGLTPEPRFEGRSLAPLLQGREASSADVIVERPHDGVYDRGVHSSGIIRGSKKLLIGRDRSAVLFDLAEDPFEASPASPSSSPEGPGLRATLDRWATGFAESSVQTSGGAPLTEDEKERLRALGYLVE
jgi:arylsulfatase A-like enzyme